MKLGEHKRVKHGQQPGDVDRWHKIDMREKRTPVYVFPWQTLNEACAKAFRRYLIDKSRTVQRRRDKRAIKEQL